MHCIILGGGGFIGSAVTDRLLQAGHVVRIFERANVKPFRQFAPDEQVEWVTGNFSDAADVSAALQGVDVVLHLVSTTTPKTSNDDPSYDVRTNLLGTIQLLHIMAIKQVTRLVFVSSGGTVYGRPRYVPMDEQHPTDPMVSYGITKLAIEKYLSLYERTHGITSIILRVANPYGERQNVESAQGAIAVFLYRALTAQPIDIWGDGSNTRDYIHVQDVAEAFLRATSYSGLERIFNIGTGIGTSLAQMLTIVRELCPIPIHTRYFPGRSFDVPVSILSNARAQRELNWVPAVEIKDGIVRTAAWLRERLGQTL